MRKKIITFALAAAMIVGIFSVDNVTARATDGNGIAAESAVSGGNLVYGWNQINNKIYFVDGNGNFLTGRHLSNGTWYEFGNDGALVSQNMNLGIDVSAHQKDIDWKAVKKAGVEFAIIRVGFRGYESGKIIADSYFAKNIKEAIDAGLRVGVYFFSSATNEVEAVEEAAHAVALINNAGCAGKLSLPIYIDIEGSGTGKGRADGLSKDKYTSIASFFCMAVSQAGYRAGVYSNTKWLSNHIDGASLVKEGYDLWVAQYNDKVTYTQAPYGTWQYSSKASIPGIKGNVDVNLGLVY